MHQRHPSPFGQAGQANIFLPLDWQCPLQNTNKNPIFDCIWHKEQGTQEQRVPSLYTGHILCFAVCKICFCSRTPMTVYHVGPNWFKGGHANDSLFLVKVVFAFPTVNQRITENLFS